MKTLSITLLAFIIFFIYLNIHQSQNWNSKWGTQELRVSAGVIGNAGIKYPIVVSYFIEFISPYRSLMIWAVTWVKFSPFSISIFFMRLNFSMFIFSFTAPITRMRFGSGMVSFPWFRHLKIEFGRNPKIFDIDLQTSLWWKHWEKFA